MESCAAASAMTTPRSVFAQLTATTRQCPLHYIRDIFSMHVCVCVYAISVCVYTKYVVPINVSYK